MTHPNRLVAYFPTKPPQNGNSPLLGDDPHFYQRRWLILLLLLAMFLLIVAGQVLVMAISKQVFTGLPFLLPEMIIGRNIRYAMSWFFKPDERSMIKIEDERGTVAITRAIADAIIKSRKPKAKKVVKGKPSNQSKATPGRGPTQPPPEN